MGLASVCHTVHQDFTGQYSNYVQTEDREYDSGGVLLGTTLISQTYNSAVTQTSSVTETLETNAFYSGEFIKNVSDSFVSETLISTTPTGGGGEIKRYDVTYIRTADVRISNGVATWWDVPEFANWAMVGVGTDHFLRYYNNASNPSLGTYDVYLQRIATWNMVADHANNIAPTGYSIDPDAIGDRDELLFGCIVKGLTIADCDDATTKTKIDALRGSAAAGETEFYYFATDDITYANATKTVNSGGSDRTIAVIGQKDGSINGPNGVGYVKARFSYGWQDLFSSPFGVGPILHGTFTERPQYTLWDIVENIDRGIYNEPISFEIPVEAELGVSIFCGDDTHRIDKIDGYDYTDTVGTSTPIFTWTKSDPPIDNGADDSYSDGIMSAFADSISGISPLEETLEDYMTFQAGDFPIPLNAGTDALFSKQIDLKLEPGSIESPISGRAHNVLFLRQDAAIAPTLIHYTHGGGVAPRGLLVTDTVNEWMSGITLGSLGQGEWGGAKYKLHVEDVERFWALDKIEFTKWGGSHASVPCDDYIACASTLDFDQASGTSKSTGIVFQRWGGGQVEWYNSLSLTGTTVELTADDVQLTIIDGCNHTFDWVFTGTTYTHNGPALKGYVSLTGAQNNATLVLNVELIRTKTGTSLDGPYTWTINGLDLTAAPFTENVAGYFQLNLHSNNQWKITGWDGTPSTAVSGTIATGNHVWSSTSGAVFSMALLYSNMTIQSSNEMLKLW